MLCRLSWGGEAAVVWAFDKYSLDVERRELRQGTARIDLEPQVFDLLVYLVRHRERVVTKDELLDVIWQGRFVSESALTTRINAARRAVGDDGARQRLIRTLRRKGFRFVGEIEERSPRAERARPQALLRMDRPTVLVQPFEPVAGAPVEHQTASALVQDVAVALGRFQWFRVVEARVGASVGARESVPDAGYVLRGAVQVRQDRLRIMARLVELSSAAQLWSESFEGPLANAYAIQDLATSTIAASLDMVIQDAEARRLAVARPERPTPMALYLQAQPVVPLLGRIGILRSFALLEQAISLDPAFGLALADAAFCLQHLDINGWAHDRRANRQRAIDYARRALAHSAEAEAVGTAAHVLAYFNDDVKAALALSLQATAVNPNLSRAWFSLGMVRLYVGQSDGALECFERALRLNPRDRVVRRAVGGMGLTDLFEGRLHDTVDRLRVVAQELPHWGTPQCALASAYLRLGHESEALAVARRLREVDKSLTPTVLQFQDARYRELMDPGLRLFRR